MKVDDGALDRALRAIDELVKRYPDHSFGVGKGQTIRYALLGLDAEVRQVRALLTGLLAAWRRTKDFLGDRLATSGRSDVNINAVLRVMNTYRDAIGSEYERLVAERDRLIASGVDPAELDVPAAAPAREPGTQG